MFELEILFANVIAPALVFGFAGLAYRWLPDHLANSVGTVLWSLSAVIAIVVAFGLRNGFAIWPEDAWQRIPQASVIIAASTILSELFLQKSKKIAVAFQLLIVLVLGLATYFVFPSGTGWEDLQKEFPRWLLVLVIGCGGTVILAGRLSNRRAAVLGFLGIPWTMVAAYLVSQSFIKVTEPILAVATVLGMASILSWKVEKSRPLHCVSGPLLFVVAAALAHGKFYSYLDTPAAVYQAVIIAPILAATVAFLPLLMFRKPRG
jgi:hypothetical protein